MSFYYNAQASERCSQSQYTQPLEVKLDTDLKEVRIEWKRDSEYNLKIGSYKPNNLGLF